MVLLDSPPETEPTVRTVPMPSDVNANGDIFGGWVLSQMDIAGGVLASDRAEGRVVTIAIEAMRFHKPIAVGEVVSLYGKIVKIGRTSITVHLETWACRNSSGKEVKVTEGTFVYVAISRDGKPRLLPDLGVA